MTRCEICGREGAEYICRICNQVVCGYCYLPEEGLCLQCARRQRLLSTPLSRPLGLMTIGTALIFAGFFLMFLASLLSIQSGEGMIIFFPFIFTHGGGWVVPIILIFFLLFLLIMFLPWLLGIRRAKVGEAGGFDK